MVCPFTESEGIPGSQEVSPAVADVVMAVVKIFIIVMAVKHIVNAELEAKVLIELVVRGQIHEEISIPCPEVAAFLSCRRPVGNKHAVQVNRPGSFVIGCSQMEQVMGNIVILGIFDLAHLPGVVDIGIPYITVVLVQGNFKAMGLLFAPVLILIAGRSLYGVSDPIPRYPWFPVSGPGSGYTRFPCWNTGIPGTGAAD